MQFNSKLKVGFKGAEVTADGGLVAIREKDEQLRLANNSREILVKTADTARAYSTN